MVRFAGFPRSCSAVRKGIEPQDIPAILRAGPVSLNPEPMQAAIGDGLVFDWRQASSAQKIQKRRLYVLRNDWRLPIICAVVF
jgi:hypothetical protein